MAETASAALECIDAEKSGVRIEFIKQGDRFAHRISIVDGQKSTLALESVEGTADEPSPPSPPFAELHQQDKTLFLTGATTLGHWSMSVQTVEDGLSFDVACRIKEKATYLGSTYRVLSKHYAIELEATTEIETEGEKLRVVPAWQEEFKMPTTIQWRYHILAQK